jgi:hypothetical protein
VGHIWRLCLTYIWCQQGYGSQHSCVSKRTTSPWNAFSRWRTWGAVRWRKLYWVHGHIFHPRLYTRREFCVLCREHILFEDWFGKDLNTFKVNFWRIRSATDFNTILAGVKRWNQQLRKTQLQLQTFALKLHWSWRWLSSGMLHRVVS